MKKKQILIIGVLAILLLFIGIISFKTIRNIKKDKETSQQQSEKIKKTYETFNELAKTFNEKNKQYQKERNAIYFATLENKEKNLVEQLKNLNKLVSEMESHEQEVRDICKITFTEKESNQYCETIKISLNTATNVYYTEVEEYNDLIEKYNIWQEENPKYKKLELYKEGENE